MEDRKAILLSYFKEANQILRKRAISLGVLMIVTIGLTYTESSRMENVIDLVNYQSRLESIMEMPDSTFIRRLEDGFHAELPLESNPYFYDRDRLFNKVKKHNNDRSFIETAIEEVDNKIERQNEEKAISILGLNIPLKPVVYVGMLIILILFHDFTQTIIHRNGLQRQIRRLNIKSWELGVEFFGSYHRADQASLRFLRITTGIVIGFLILSPLITSIMILNLNKSNSELVAILNVVGFSIIIIDTIIVFYTTNIWNFRFISNWYLGNYKIRMAELRYMWLLTLIGIILFQLSVSMDLRGEYKKAGFDYFILSVMPVVALYLALEICHKKRTNLWRSIRAALLILNTFWIYATINSTLSYFPISQSNIRDLYGLLGISSLISVAISFVYLKFFVARSRTAEAPRVI